MERGGACGGAGAGVPEVRGGGSRADGTDLQTEGSCSEVVFLFLPPAVTWKMGSRAAGGSWTLSLGRVSAAPSSPLSITANGASPSCTARTATMSLCPRLCPGPPRPPATCEALSSV